MFGDDFWEALGALLIVVGVLSVIGVCAVGYLVYQLVRYVVG